MKGRYSYWERWGNGGLRLKTNNIPMVGNEKG